MSDPYAPYAVGDRCEWRYINGWDKFPHDSVRPDEVAKVCRHRLRNPNPGGRPHSEIFNPDFSECDSL